MNNFEFKIARKVTVWQYEYFTIPAETKEEAIELAKAEVDEISGQYNNYIDTDFETVDELPVEENDGWATVELVDLDTAEILFENGVNLDKFAHSMTNGEPIDFSIVKIKDSL